MNRMSYSEPLAGHPRLNGQVTLTELDSRLAAIEVRLGIRATPSSYPPIVVELIHMLVQARARDCWERPPPNPREVSMVVPPQQGVALVIEKMRLVDAILYERLREAFKARSWDQVQAVIDTVLQSH